jgi:hypothetical protein
VHSIESLKAELAAIEYWDQLYWTTENPEPYETLACLARCKRRKWIIGELLRVSESYEEQLSLLAWLGRRTSS